MNKYEAVIILNPNLSNKMESFMKDFDALLSDNSFNILKKEDVGRRQLAYSINNNKQFSDYTLELFKNDELWTSIKNNLKEIRGSKNWLKCTKSFLKAVNESI